ncbi:PDZ domain-containing protein [Halomonas urmiana]|uniref:PDZ domain-containing protein n=1 Tax=Halomonas urmiana TaxID=490901 RepID=A0A5R8M913_9GAMM|nr:ChaN family lipoprotein [Halomonas urmiana]TLF45995.1 PDZ domain-containing protein [Halomonas urmiana]
MSPTRFLRHRFRDRLARPAWLAVALAVPFSAVLAAPLDTPLEAPFDNQGQACPAPGQWVTDDGQRRSTAALMPELAERRVLLLGERHDRLDHHRWQLHTLAALHAHRPSMVIGLEMLPREAQPALDAWTAGELDEAGFLAASDWQRAWGFDPALYLPILHFARMQRIPLVALNVTPALRGRLAAQGWAAVPAEERFGITPPAPAAPAYRERLTAIFEQHADRDDDTAGLARFIAAQLVWDRAMAVALSDAARPDTLVVGLMGQGHLGGGDGVPAQLDDLGLTDHRSLLPWTPTGDCAAPTEHADARYVLGDESAFQPADPLRLGVLLEAHSDGVRIVSVGEESVAEQAGLEAGDMILTAAGVDVESPTDLSAILRRQAPGTLLPLGVRRNGVTRERLARFPPAN